MGSIVTVNFRNDTLFAVERDDGVYVAIKPICDTLGIDWKAQRDRLTRNPVLSEGRVVMPLPSVGGTQETVCLRLDLINGWLFGIDADRVRAEVRDRVLEYQRECYRVLFEHFYGRGHRLEAPEETDEDASENESIKLRMVNETRHVFGNQAAAQLWFKLKLPVVPAMLHDPRQAELFTYTAIKAAPDIAAGGA